MFPMLLDLASTAPCICSLHSGTFSQFCLANFAFLRGEKRQDNRAKILILRLPVHLLLLWLLWRLCLFDGATAECERSDR